MKGRKALVGMHIIFKSIISVYFDTFFVMYFFKTANYEVAPIVKYYFTLYFFLFIGFILIKNMMKKNVKVPYMRIGISMQALYVAIIMLLKENIVNWIFLVGLVRGIANGFYYYPNNLLNTEKIDNKERHKFDGIISTTTSIMSIIIPLILGVALTYMSYTDVGKIFFIFFIIMFILTFFVEDMPYTNKKSDIKGFLKLLKKEKRIRDALIMSFLGGLTYLSGAFLLIITLTKVINSKTNLALGVIESVCAVIALAVGIIYSLKLSNERLSKIIKVGGVLTFVSLLIYAFIPNLNTFIPVLLINSSFIALFNLVHSTAGISVSNYKEIKSKYKAEYLLMREFAFCFSRCLGYLFVYLSCIWFGKEVLSYILIIAGTIILFESFITSKFIKNT